MTVMRTGKHSQKTNFSQAKQDKKAIVQWHTLETAQRRTVDLSCVTLRHDTSHAYGHLSTNCEKIQESHTIYIGVDIRL